MKKNIKILFLYFLFALLSTIYIFGFDLISFTNSSWLSTRDMTADLLSWQYFKNDAWRFPIGNNPNYGIDIATSIVFSGSIPFLCILFKIFGNFLPNNFHFFSLWIFVCFFLQSFISFLIIYDNTKNLTFSIIGSLFFLISPIFISQIMLHLALAGHWLILMGFYVEKRNIPTKKTFYWTTLISLSALIHFYFTIILFGMFLLFIFHEYLINFNTKKLIIRILIPTIFLLITMYIFGYFKVPFTDSLAHGYGIYKLNLLGIVSPILQSQSGIVDWSLFLPEISASPAEKSEGFSYLGIGGIILLLIGIFIIFTNITEFKKKNYRPYFFIIILFLLIALTNRISFANILLLEIDLPKYIYGILSIVRASGRLFWPVYYLFFLGSIIIIYNKFSKKKSLYILLCLFLFQLIDISSGLKNYYKLNAFKKEKIEMDNLFWNKLSKKNNILKTTYLSNETRLLMGLRDVLLSQNFKSTDISTHGRYNRKAASVSRSKLYKAFDEAILEKDTIFVIDNKNHLRNLKYLYENKNMGFFFKNNIWIIVPGKKNEMTDFDKYELNDYDPIILASGKKIILNFRDEQSVHGFGWSHSYFSPNPGIWTEGNISTLLFKIDEKTNADYTIKIKLGSLITKKNKPINFSININDIIVKKFSLMGIGDLNENLIKLTINKEMIPDNIYYIKFMIDNPTSPLELLQSPDARKLGILIESIEIENN
tara:strand:- start:2186 stop:4315 length:2130 start_codon:yes stop_codon:yes gene_type:complete